MKGLVLLTSFLTAAANYTMVDPRPRCHFTLGSRYCPVSARWTSSYMSYIQRLHLTFVNTARADPSGFAATYGGVVYACGTSTQLPFSYESQLHQSALQQSWILAQTGCPFSHNTCGQFCSLYPSCDWLERIKKYLTFRWSSVAENIALTVRADDPLTVLKQWLASAGHCRNIFAGHSHFGVGNTGRYWVQNMATTTAIPRYPIASGAHWVNPQLNNMRFLVNAVNATKVVLRYFGRTYTMTLHLGNTVYAYDVERPPANASCRTYFFNVTRTDGKWYRLPEAGSFQTSHVGDCTNNWVSW